MPNENSPEGRMIIRGGSTGQVGDDDIRQRALEIAKIRNGENAQATPQDHAQAEAELLGHALPETTEDDASTSVAISRDPSEPPSDSGQQAPMHEEPDEERALERMVLEGVEEAQHDQMIEARRTHR